jgi:hypothetical protein
MLINQSQFLQLLGITYKTFVEMLENGVLPSPAPAPEGIKKHRWYLHEANVFAEKFKAQREEKRRLRKEMQERLKAKKEVKATQVLTQVEMPLKTLVNEPDSVYEQRFRDQAALAIYTMKEDTNISDVIYLADLLISELRKTV